MGAHVHGRQQCRDSPDAKNCAVCHAPLVNVVLRARTTSRSGQLAPNFPASQTKATHHRSVPATKDSYRRQITSPSRPLTQPTLLMIIGSKGPTNSVRGRLGTAIAEGPCHFNKDDEPPTVSRWADSHGETGATGQHAAEHLKVPREDPIVNDPTWPPAPDPTPPPGLPHDEWPPLPNRHPTDPPEDRPMEPPIDRPIGEPDPIDFPHRRTRSHRLRRCERRRWRGPHRRERRGRHRAARRLALAFPWAAKRPSKCHSLWLTNDRGCRSQLLVQRSNNRLYL